VSISEATARRYGLREPVRLTAGILRRELALVLEDAANEAERLVRMNIQGQLSIGNQIETIRLKSASQGLDTVSREMWHSTENVTTRGIYRQAQLAADQSIAIDMAQGLPRGKMLDLAGKIHWNAEQAANAIISRRTNGFALSDRIYRNARHGVRQAERVVERGLALQRSARQIARDVKHLYDPSVPGGQSYAAMRLARTEINNAHHETTKRLAQGKPWVTGMKWNLSGSHPRPDICNELAEKDPDGIGVGVYKPNNVPSKPHPNCFCYVTHQMVEDDEFLDRLASGSYDRWIDENI
jgi:hypothetical protein